MIAGVRTMVHSEDSQLGGGRRDPVGKIERFYVMS